MARESLRLTLDELGIDSADFAGWSAGGNTLLDFVLAHPHRVRSLALVEPASYWILEQAGESEAEVDDYHQLLVLSGRQDGDRE